MEGRKAGRERSYDELTKGWKGERMDGKKEGRLVGKEVMMN